MRDEAMLARFRAGCAVCGAMDWFAVPLASGECGYQCGSCGNLFDVALVDEPRAATEGDRP